MGLLAFILFPAETASKEEDSLKIVEIERPRPVYKAERSPESLIAETFPDDPRMLEVLRCESNLRQFDRAGEPLMSPTRDFGIAQINERVWDATAQRLGLDYKHSLEDNLKMARYVYDVQGIQAWVCFNLI